jgi:hypothetical protein
MTQRINITDYTTAFTEYPQDFRVFCDTKSYTSPEISTRSGQALALMAQPENRGMRYLIREDTDKFFAQLGLPRGDSIQQFNKTQVKRVPGKGKYCLQYPFVLNETDIKKRDGAVITGDRNEQINAIKQWWRDNLVDVPNDAWQIGHLDPTIPDASQTNLAFQPPLQARYRNRFKWDRLFHIMWPTAQHELIPHIDSYYTEDEQRLIYEKLREKFA